MQGEFAGSAFDLRERHFTEQCNGIVIQFSPANGIEIAKDAVRFVIPAPPEVPCERPEAFLHGSDELIESSSLAYDGRHLSGGFHEHLNFFSAEITRLDRLNNKNTLEN